MIDLPKLQLCSYLDGMRAAMTADELEAAIRAPFIHTYRGPTWARISKVQVEVGMRICAAHPHGRFVPRFGSRRELTVCGEMYRVGRGQNSTGVRYVWHGAGVWARDTIVRNGLSIRAAHRIWDNWGDYPHRCLSVVEDALAGRIADPPMDTMLRHSRPEYGRPINYTIEANEADEGDRRATRSCDCGGTLFDWGAGHSEGFEFVNWHCNKCPDVFTEYMSQERLYALRKRPAAAGSLLDGVERNAIPGHPQ